MNKQRRWFNRFFSQTPMSASRTAFRLGVTLVLVVLIVSVVNFVRSIERIQANILYDANGGKSEFDQRIATDLEFLALLDNDFTKAADGDTFFQTRSTLFLKEHPELIGIFRTDANFRVEWIAPNADSESFSGYTISLSAPLAAARSARDTGKTTFSDPYVSLNGKHVIAVFLPLFIEGRFSGVIEGMFSLQGLLDNAIPEWVNERYELHLLDAQGEILAHETSMRNTDLSLSATTKLDSFSGHMLLRIDAYEDKQAAAMRQTVALTLVAIVGIFIALIILRLSLVRLSSLHDDLAVAKETADKANSAKSLFVSGLSHEIRTPLGAMIGYADLMGNSTPSDMKNFALSIKRNGEMLIRLVNEILDLSKIEAGLLDVDIHTFALDQLLHDIVDTLRPQAQQKSLAITVNFASAVPQKIESDPVRLRQILLNLMHNAIKFSEKGEIKLNVSQAPGNQDQILFDVSDSGIGISQAAQATLFQPFVQADSSITRRYGGTGLGLALSRRMAYLLDGELILAQSEVGKGSSFRLTIATGRVDQSVTIEVGLLKMWQPDEIVPKPRLQRLRKMSILLVDDSPDNQIIMKRYLELEGAATRSALSGEEALNTAIATDIDIILMDIEMPGISGYETTARLRQMNYKKPIIALTAHAMKGEKDRCLLAGCNDYLTKPVSRDQLVATISQFFPQDESCLEGT